MKKEKITRSICNGIVRVCQSARKSRIMIAAVLLFVSASAFESVSTSADQATFKSLFTDISLHNRVMTKEQATMSDQSGEPTF